MGNPEKKSGLNAPFGARCFLTNGTIGWGIKWIAES